MPLLGIRACTYVKIQFIALLEQRTGIRSVFWKTARIGERLSPWVAVGCFIVGVSIIFF
ncbi:protein kish [Phtheirospermum japonicum]|uniref:Protein kish n=1 Tax=Phtheirospermum japonicum TaxID=374723 RepID=A0A830BJ78_9LAMI|nr:protein kish [Phtheirospermum japonicum]